MTTMHPIADLLHIEPTGGTILINGRAYDYMTGDGRIGGTCETLYRRDAGHGVSNPGFSLVMTPITHHCMVLGGYLAGRQGVKRTEAELLVTNASVARQ